MQSKEDVRAEEHVLEEHKMHQEAQADFPLELETKDFKEKEEDEFFEAYESHKPTVRDIAL